jgi:hypothetical protein
MVSTTQTTDPRSDPRYPGDDDSSFNSAILDILPENIPNTIITKAPEERFRLGYWSVIALVVNRVIGHQLLLIGSGTMLTYSTGTGIFNSPSTVMRGTKSVGISLLFWLAGALYTIAGTHVNIEFGLSTPRHKFEGIEQGIPRSGGTLNYVSLCTVALSKCICRYRFYGIEYQNFGVIVLFSWLVNLRLFTNEPDHKGVLLR